MKAIIMAGGEGTRLRPLTSSLPKPMVPIANKPVMQYIIELLANYKIVDIGVTTYYLPSMISDFFGEGDRFGVKLSYFIEEMPLGTGGSVLNTDDFPKDTLLVISGDSITDINLEEALQFHKSKNSLATLILKREPIPLEYGIVITDSNDKIVRFLEKPTWGEVFSDTINTGIYILEPEVFNYYKKGDNFDFSKDLFPKLLKDNVPMYGHIAEGYWCDIGDFHSYNNTHFDLLNNKIKLKNTLTQVDKGIWMDTDCQISKDVIMHPPVYIGKGCTIGHGTTIDAFTIIGDHCEIDEYSSIKKSIIWNNVHIGKNVQCRGTTICGNTILKNNVNLFENSIIGADSILNSGVTVKPNIKIWPGKVISENTVVNRNLIWGSKLSRILFGNNDICGEVNIDLTPEFSSSLGSTFASVTKNTSPILVSSDGLALSYIIKNSLVSGILSTGKTVIVLNNIITPMCRFGIRFFKCSSGIHIRTDYENKNKVHIEFFNELGGNIDRKTEKNIENLFFRGDFERCPPNRIKNITEINDFSSVYFHLNIAQLSNAAEIKRKEFKVLLNSPSNLVSSLAAAYLERLGCTVKVDNDAVAEDNFHTASLEFSEKVKSFSCDLGILMNENGEKITLFDEMGTAIGGEKYTVFCALIVLKARNISKLIVPYTTTKAVDTLAKEYNVQILRSKSSVSELINEILKNCSENSAYYTQYALNFDGIAACGYIFDFLTTHAISISALINEIPDFHIKKNELRCDFETRGYIIRKLIEECEKENLELFEGVKINFDNGWYLVIPDNEQPIFNIFTEGFSEEYADELFDIASKKIQALIDNKNQ